MREYINSLENNGSPMTEQEWRTWIDKEIADVKKQNPEATTADPDEVISILYNDGYIIDRFQDDAIEILSNTTLDSIAPLMDDNIREAIHADKAPCSDTEFLAAYMAAHYIQYNEIFTV